MSEPPPARDFDRRLRCNRCGCVLEVTADEMLRFSRGDWPRCCVLPMVLEVDDQAVSPGDKTALERPPRRPRERFRR